MDAPKLEPVALKQYTYKQSRFPQAPELPCRSCLLSPSGGGKTVLIQNLILDVYRGCFERIYVFSPTVHLDQTWQPVKEYCEKHLDIGDEQCYFEEFNVGKIMEVMEDQKRIIEDMKKKGKKKLWGVLCVIDDFADDHSAMRGSKGNVLKSLYVRGRHYGISTIIGTQKYRLLSPVIRTQATALFCFRLRSMQDLDAFLEEGSALLGKKRLMDLYRQATAEPYSFLMIDLQAKTPEDMFWLRLEKPLL